MIPNSPSSISTGALVPWLEKPMWPARVAKWMVEKVTCLDVVNRQFRAAEARSDDYFQAVQEAFGYEYEILSGQWDVLPATGPVLVVANHPRGGKDAIALGHFITRVRQDVRFLANRSINPESVLGSWMIPVDVFGSGASAARANALAARSVIRHWQRGGVIGGFPAAVVSHWQPGLKKVADRLWAPGLFNLALRQGVSVLPLWFESQNSSFFQWAGRVSPVLRSLLLPREGIRCRGEVIGVRVGELLRAEDLPATGEEVARFVQERSEALSRVS